MPDFATIRHTGSDTGHEKQKPDRLHWELIRHFAGRGTHWKNTRSWLDLRWR
jgi:hypothetical protein